MIILNRRTSLLLSAAAIIILGLLVYSNTFHASFHFDDDSNIVANYAVRNVGASALFKFWATRFLTYYSFALDFSFHQLRVPGYHIFNLAVHIGAALTVWWLALLTLGTPAMKLHPHTTRFAGAPSPIKGEDGSGRPWLLALFSGLLFVCHPVQTEAVTYIVQRATSLAAFFYLLALCLYIKSRLLQEPGDG